MFDAAVRPTMRTTLAIDDDVLAAARALARQQQVTVGKVVSDLARQSLCHPLGLRAPKRQRNGVPLLPVSNAKVVVTLEIVNALRDELDRRLSVGAVHGGEQGLHLI